VRLEAVSKRHGWRKPFVISDVHLTVPSGSVTVINGANGSGKTTLLKIIAGVSHPTSGAVLGRPRRVGMVPDRFVAPVRMTAGAYLEHHGRIRGLACLQARRRAEELAEELSLAPGLAANMDSLSKGNAQKVALAQAFLAPVDLLVLDEPTTALDRAGGHACGRLVETARAAGAAVVLSNPGSSPLATMSSAAHHYRIRAGRLEPHFPVGKLGEEMVTIRLRRRPPYGAEVVGVDADSMSLDGDEATLVVSAKQSDEVLRSALGHGWSVIELRSNPPFS
jgi:ABC-type multidrug transport system ATPase subunit